MGSDNKPVIEAGVVSMRKDNDHRARLVDNLEICHLEEENFMLDKTPPSVRELRWPRGVLVQS